MQRKNLIRVLDCYPEIYGGRYFDYKAKKMKSGYYKIFRRCFEGDDWRLYCRCVVVDDILFTNWVGNFVTFQEELDKNGYFTEHPQDKERFICGATKRDS